MGERVERNLEWAKSMARSFLRNYRVKKEWLEDLESAAAFGLALSDSMPGCPVDSGWRSDTDFRPYASVVIWGRLIEELRILIHGSPSRVAYRRGHSTPMSCLGDKGTGQAFDWTDPRSDFTRQVDWADERNRLAKLMAPDEKEVFLRLFGEDKTQAPRYVAKDLGIGVREVERRRSKFMRRVRAHYQEAS